jgi:hypothetical protein
MKVEYQKTVEYKVKQRIEKLQSNAILRSEVADLGSPREISRALKKLKEKGEITKLGYGVYGKLERSSITNRSYLKVSFLSIAREALTKLKVDWEPSDAEVDYNQGRSTQIPVNPNTKINKRFRRKISYKNMELDIEK